MVKNERCPELTGVRSLYPYFWTWSCVAHHHNIVQYWIRSTATSNRADFTSFSLSLFIYIPCMYMSSAGLGAFSYLGGRKLMRNQTTKVQLPH